MSGVCPCMRSIRSDGAAVASHETVTAGRYQSASEVVRIALSLLEQREQQKAAALEWLAQEIQKGLDSGASEPVTAEFWQGLRAKLSSCTAANNA